MIRAEALPAAEVLQSATLVNARLLGLEGDVGVVEPGARADLVVVNGDPIAKPSLLDGQGEHLPLIVQAGRLVHDEIS